MFTTIARRAAAGGAIAALLTAASAVSGIGSLAASAYSTTSDGGVVRLTLTEAEMASTSSVSFRTAVCSDATLVQQLAANTIAVPAADCQQYLVWCASSDFNAVNGTQVVFSRDGVSCVW